MPRKATIICDRCGKSLSGPLQYRLKLRAQREPGDGGATMADVFVTPPIWECKYFCNLDCIEWWISCGPRKKKKTNDLDTA